MAPSKRALGAGFAAARFGDTEVRAPVYLMSAPAGAAGVVERPFDAGVRRFMGTPAGNWRASRANSDAAPGSGVLVAVVSPPTDDRPDAVVLDGRPIDLLWAEDAEDAAPANPAPDLSPWLTGALDGLRRSPLTRWRARLAAGEDIVQPAGARDALPDPVAEGLARQVEARWAVALDRVARASAPLGARLRARLAAVVDFGGGVRVPAWGGGAEETGGLDALLDVLDDPGAGDDRLSAAAESWLGVAPAGGALVLDDAADLDGARCVTGPSLLLINLSPAPASVWAAPEGSGGPEPDQLPVGPLGVTVLVVPPRPEEAAIAGLADPPPERRGPGRYAVHVGPWSAVRAAADRCARATPPGFGLGPTLPDWTLAGLLGAATDPTPGAPLPLPAAGAAVAGRLLRAGADGADAGRWTVYLERTAPPGGSGGTWEVAVHFGPSGPAGHAEPRAALRVASDGTLSELRGGSWVGAGRAVMTRDGPRTSVWVPVPAGAVEGDEGSAVLRLGLVHTDELGRRSAWPRPMLPWQSEPGRVAVDLSAWSPAPR